MNRAEELIADLEAEIVKRDARIEAQTLDIERITKAYTLELDELAQRNYNMRFELAELEQQRGGVVLPERDDRTDARLADYVEGWNACLDEVARLNPPGESVAAPTRSAIESALNKASGSLRSEIMVGEPLYWISLSEAERAISSLLAQKQ